MAFRFLIVLFHLLTDLFTAEVQVQLGQSYRYPCTNFVVLSCHFRLQLNMNVHLTVNHLSTVVSLKNNWSQTAKEQNKQHCLQLQSVAKNSEHVRSIRDHSSCPRVLGPLDSTTS